jgi:uncharacterized repeat protein (TIGR02543 family)
MGGSPSSFAPIAIDGSTTSISLPDSLSKYGYSFGGWYTEETGGVRFGGSVELRGDITLYARWSAVNVRVIFVANGAMVSQSNLTFGSNYAVPTAFSATGYAFGGWYAKDGANGDFGTEVTDKTAIANASTHYVYAKLTAMSGIRVSFDKDGGTGDAGDILVTYGAFYGPLPAPTMSGKVFDGWWTGVGGTGVEVKSGTVVKVITDITLYASWRTSRTVTIVDGDGKVIGEVVIGDGKKLDKNNLDDLAPDGLRLTGLLDENGNKFDPDSDAVNGDVKLTARFAPPTASPKTGFETLQWLAWAGGGLLIGLITGVVYVTLKRGFERKMQA